MGQLYGKCVRLIYDFALTVKTCSLRLMENIEECLAPIYDCPCLRRRNFETKQLYKSVLQHHEEKLAHELLQNIEKVNIQLPAEHLENCYALLKSNDLEVQQISSLSLVTFLLEGNVNKDHVLQMDLLEPILELLESVDFSIQCNACACIMTLAVLSANQDAIAAAGEVVPLLALSKSNVPTVQQLAVGAVFNLTQSVQIQKTLCRQGGLPVLTLLLESPDSEVQYYSCAALSNIATNSHHHEVMLQIGDRFLLRILPSLLSSSVQKVSNQACICLRNLATSETVQTSMLAISILPHLLPLLTSNDTDIQHNSIILLRMLSQHPANQLEYMHEGFAAWSVQFIEELHASCMVTIRRKNGCLGEGAGNKKSGDHPRSIGSHIARETPNAYENLTKKKIAHTKIVRQPYEMDLPGSRRQENLPPTHEAPREDSEFLSAFRQSKLKKHLDQVRQQTEETQELLRMAISHMDA